MAHSSGRPELRARLRRVGRIPMFRAQAAAQEVFDDDIAADARACASAASVAAGGLIAGSGATAAARSRPPASLRRTARSTSSSSRKTRGNATVERARAHPLRLLRQCLRGLCAAVPPGHRSSTTARARSRSAICAPPPGKTAPPRSYVFNSQNYLNQRLLDTVDGKAERQPDQVAVTLTKPQDKQGRSRGGDRVPDRSRAPHHRGGARGQDHPGISGL